MQLIGTTNVPWALMSRSLFSNPNPDYIVCEGWMKTPALTGNGICEIGFKDDAEYVYAGAGLNITNGNGMIFCRVGGTIQNIQVFSYDQWYKVRLAFTASHHSISVWVNDTLKVSNVAGVMSSTVYTRFFMRAGSGTIPFDFDDIKIWY